MTSAPLPCSNDFAAFVSAAPSASSTSAATSATTATTGNAEEKDFFNQTAASAAEDKAKSTKDSIMALFGKQQQNGFGQPQQQMFGSNFQMNQPQNTGKFLIQMAFSALCFRDLFLNMSSPIRVGSATESVRRQSPVQPVPQLRRHRGTCRQHHGGERRVRFVRRCRIRRKPVQLFTGREDDFTTDTGVIKDKFLF